MSAGVLQFAIGIETSKFLEKLGASAREVVGFAAAVEVGHFAIDKMWEAVNQGAALEGLSARTNQTTQSLYGLQMGFKAVGLSGGEVPGLIMRMQKSLSGVNEMGESTGLVFARMGLDLKQLRGQTAAQQIETIAGSLKKFSTTDATGLASKLFGRFQAGDFLQISRSLDEYHRVMAETKGDASVFGAMAKAWQEIKGDAEIFESHINAVWAAIASGITPKLHKAFEEVNNLTKNLGPALAGAFEAGGITTLLKDSLLAALEQGGYYGERIFEALAIGFGDALFTAMKVAMDDFLPMFWNALKNGAKYDQSKLVESAARSNAQYFEQRAGDAGKAGDKESQSKYLKEATKEWGVVSGELKYQADLIDGDSKNFHQHLSNAFKTAGDGMQQMVEDVVKSWSATADPKKPHAALDKLSADAAKFAAAWVKNHPESSSTDDNENGLKLENHYKPEYTNFEKMGFVMSGLGNPMKRAEDLLQQIVNKLPGKNEPMPTPAVNYSV